MENIVIAGLDQPASRIALGTWAIGGWMWGGSDESDAIGTIQAALDLGVTLIDTAPVYGFGCAEEIVGKALQGGRRGAAIIATKAGIEWRDGAVLRNSSPARLRAELEIRFAGSKPTSSISIRCIGQTRGSPSKKPRRHSPAFKKEGKIRAIGVSNFSPAQMDRFRSAAPLASVQPPYNLFERAIEQDILPYAKANGPAVLAYGALCRGLLAGKITEKTVDEGDDLRKIDPKFQPPRLQHYLNAVRRLDEFARERYGKSVLALAVRWVLDQGPTVALWGARRPEQLSPVNDVLGWTIDQEGKHAIDDILTETIKDPVGPEFDGAFPKQSRLTARRPGGTV